MAGRIVTFLLVLSLAVAGCAAGETGGRGARSIIRDIVTLRGQSGPETRMGELMAELEEADLDAALRWQEILKLWDRVNTDLEIHEDVLPDGLPDTDELCIVVLGFHLFSDGRMRQELVERLMRPEDRRRFFD